MVASAPAWLRTRRRQLALAAAGIFLVIAGVVFSELVRIRHELDLGRAELGSLDLAGIEEEGGLDVVADGAADHFEEAARIAHRSPVLRALSVVPGLGSQVDGIRALTDSAVVLGAEGRRAGAELETAIDGLPGGGGAARLELVATASSVIQRLLTTVEGIEPETRWLIPVLDGARDALGDDLDEAAVELDQAGRAAAALEGLLRGPRRYLIAVGNNAEMRALGVVTASGVAEISAGELAVGGFIGNLEETAVREGVPVPDEWRALYGWRGGHIRYPGTVYTPSFPTAAPIMAELSRNNIHGPVDGVIYVDSVTLSAILEVIGPVEVEGRTYTGDNVVEELLFRNYLEFGNVDESTERRSLQSQIATAAFDAIDTRDFSVFALSDAMSRMARTRHLLGWSADPTENELWQLLGADGHLERDDVLVEVGNLGASKLDYFVTVKAELTTEAGDYERRATLAVTITNPTRPETSPYIEGTSGMIEEPGEHVAWLLFFLPQYAQNITALDFPGFGMAGPDGPLFASGVVVRIPVGESRTYTISFDLPILQDELTILPSARIKPTEWTIVGVEGIPDYVPFRVNLESGEIDDEIDRTLEEPAVTPP